MRSPWREKQVARIQIKIEPSLKISPGVYIHVNQHHQLDESNEDLKGRTQKFLSLLQDSCVDFLSYADTVSTQLFSSYEKKVR